MAKYRDSDHQVILLSKKMASYLQINKCDLYSYYKRKNKQVICDMIKGNESHVGNIQF